MENYINKNLNEIESSEKLNFDTAKTLNTAKTQRNQRRAKLCASADFLRFSGVNTLIKG